MGEKRAKERKVTGMKKMIQDIHKGKNVKENLRRYAEVAIQTYADYGTLELTFSAYTLLEEVLEKEEAYAQEEAKTMQKVLASLGELSRGECPFEKLAQQMDTLREEITKKMDLLTAYTDRLICYEYVLNRMEFRFLPEKELIQSLAGFPEEEYMDKLNRYLFGDRDKQVMHDKIRLVVGQIPVQMTKGKLFERIGEALTLYNGDDRSALDRFLYMLRTASMVYEPTHYVGQYTGLEHVLTCLKEADYVHLTKEQFDKLAELLENGSKEIQALTDFYYSVQKVVNGIYALCVILPYVRKESQLQKAGRQIWHSLADRKCQEEMLLPMEGQIESLVEKSSYLESVLFEIQSSYGEELAKEGLTSLFENFVMVANLLSDSLFVELSEEEEEKADAAYVQSCANQLFDELTEKMSQVSRPVKRAIMGQILEKLPIVFQNREEVEQYIRVNLMGCPDRAEKCVVLTMLWDLMMEEEQEWS